MQLALLLPFWAAAVTYLALFRCGLACVAAAAAVAEGRTAGAVVGRRVGEAVQVPQGGSEAYVVGTDRQGDAPQ
jgi:hypothetical protein